MLGDVEAERGGLDGILAGGLQDQPHGGARQAEQDGAADCHEAERVPVVGAVVDGQHVGQVEADLAPGDAGEQDDGVLQQQHGDQGHQAEIRAAV